MTRWAWMLATCSVNLPCKLYPRFHRLEAGATPSRLLFPTACSDQVCVDGQVTVCLAVGLMGARQ